MFVSHYGFVPSEINHADVPFEYLPRELGCGNGTTRWRRLHEWMHAGVWQRVHDAVLRRLREHDQITRDQASVDAASVPASAGGKLTGRNPTDLGKLGCKYHLLVEQRGLPLIAQLSGAQVPESRLLIPLVESIPAVKDYLAARANAQVSYTLAERTPHVHTGLGCAVAASRHELRDKASSRERLGQSRSAVEWTLGWLHRFRRLRIRHKQRADIHQAFLSFACSLICLQYVERLYLAF
jgi:transposase